MNRCRRDEKEEEKPLTTVWVCLFEKIGFICLQYDREILIKRR